MQLICVDEQHFGKLRSKNGVYVDKTKQMYQFFKNGGYFFLARPRRFGKSLLCSTLADLYAGNRELFKNTWIDSSDWDWQTYPVIRLDMIQAGGADATAPIVRQRLTNLLMSIAQKNNVDITNAAGPSDILRQLVAQLHATTGKNVVIIIDEYDKPLLDVLHHPERYPAIHDELRALYGQLKSLSQYLHLVFLTGVFKFAQTSVFSGLNNIKDLTFDFRAGELLGYTEPEILQYFNEHLTGLANKFGISISDMMSKLRKEYNGYCFGMDVDTGKLASKVYNPFALNYVFADQQMLKKWFVSATPSALVTKLKEKNFIGVDSAQTTVLFSTIDASSEPDKISALNMLYYAGYLTIKAYDPETEKVALDYPNAEVSTAMSHLLLPLITDVSDTALRTIAESIAKALKTQQPMEILPLLNQALAQLTYFLFTSEESYYQTVFYMLLQMGNLNAVAEDMMNCGRMDLSLVLPKAVYIFELKMDQSAEIAIAQVKERGYAEKYRHLGLPIFGIGIKVTKKKKVMAQMLVEQI